MGLYPILENMPFRTGSSNSNVIPDEFIISIHQGSEDHRVEATVVEVFASQSSPIFHQDVLSV